MYLLTSDVDDDTVLNSEFVGGFEGVYGCASDEALFLPLSICISFRVMLLLGGIKFYGFATY
jgi:hypothetical protein